jgi:hypothetical protein
MVDATPPPEPSPTPPSLDSAEIRGLVREELDRNNKYLEFAQGQIEKDRNFYKHLYQVAGHCHSDISRRRWFPSIQLHFSDAERYEGVA